MDLYDTYLVQTLLLTLKQTSTMAENSLQRVAISPSTLGEMAITLFHFSNVLFEYFEYHFNTLFVVNYVLTNIITLNNVL